MSLNARASGIDDTSFKQLAAIVYSESGIVLSDNKRNLLVSRLSRRLRELKIGGFPEYCQYLKSSSGGEELRNITSLLTTNVTRFFRENHHFEALKTEILPPLMSRARSGGQVRIWSAGCSTGEEPYSIAIQLLECMPDAGRHDIKIIATDIDPNVIKTGRAGVYQGLDDKQMEKRLRDRYFVAVPDRPRALQAKDELKKLISFDEVNLLRPWPVKGPIDVIFCRNVVIYFDAQTQSKLWGRFSEILSKDGFLIIGHSERVGTPESVGLVHSGITKYRRV
ncbi:Chemotaxis protein methyltransferase CheR [Candidatus Rhodobacter oscarellae]|uniref:Chemotaxis protein methyltransferase n=1 Tax=Candidatus Rhodobacter oscarellae TaxID=1675527 RepID=A0A0J9ED82_9RHOB|nr:protein-glutamate O-methyltransferase [Candidatus Rhodobacter lobularis]KMW60665.1 Chemotaxis protein methyltransferase CheR [Candidatus Rhodobacter lobularis]